jgi:hypothetical protein
MSLAPTQSKPFAQSLTIRAAAAMALAYVAGKMGQTLPYDSAEQLITAASDLVFALGAIGVGVGRARARAPLH